MDDKNKDLNFHIKRLDICSDQLKEDGHKALAAATREAMEFLKGLRSDKP